MPKHATREPSQHTPEWPLSAPLTCTFRIRPVGLALVPRNGLMPLTR